MPVLQVAPSKVSCEWQVIQSETFQALKANSRNWMPDRRCEFCYRAAMVTVWHAIEPYFLTFGGFAFLVLIVRTACKGVTSARYGGKIYRAESPFSFWFFVVLNLILGFALVGAGIASFFNEGK